jgi:hypothetical protein
MSKESRLRGRAAAEDFLDHAIKDIDDYLGKGYAAKHPELIAAYMQTAAIREGKRKSLGSKPDPSDRPTLKDAGIEQPRRWLAAVNMGAEVIADAIETAAMGIDNLTDPIRSIGTAIDAVDTTLATPGSTSLPR